MIEQIVTDQLHEPVCQLPLPGARIGAELAVSVWLGLLLQALGTSSRPGLVLWTPGKAEAQESVLFYLGDPSPRGFLAWLEPEAESDRIWDLLAAMEGAGPAAPRDADERELLQDPELLLAGLSKHLPDWVAT